VEGSEEDQEVVAIPEEAIKHLPEEWQQSIQEFKERTLGILASVDENLRNVTRIANAFPAMVSLRYIQHRLAKTEFEPTMEWALENDMLTLAFVTTYARLVDGGIGTGFSRGALPAELRPVHDKIIELRNKRYAHNAGHHSIEGELEIGFAEDKFDVNVKYNMGFHVGGALEWRPLVEFLDDMMLTRMHAQLAKLKERTGHEWTFPSGDGAPIWA
jgi:hypothetical protein